MTSYLNFLKRLDEKTNIQLASASLSLLHLSLCLSIPLSLPSLSTVINVALNGYVISLCVLYVIRPLLLPDFEWIKDHSKIYLNFDLKHWTHLNELELQFNTMVHPKRCWIWWKKTLSLPLSCSLPLPPSLSLSRFLSLSLSVSFSPSLSLSLYLFPAMMCFFCLSLSSKQLEALRTRTNSR